MNATINALRAVTQPSAAAALRAVCFVIPALRAVCFLVIFICNYFSYTIRNYKILSIRNIILLVII